MEASASRARASTGPHASYCCICWVQHLFSKGTDLAVPVTSVRLLHCWWWTTAGAGTKTEVTFSPTGKTEESLESSEGFRTTEQGSQKPAADSPASACIAVRPPASAPALWDGRKRADPLGEPAAFPQGLPAGAEEQRQFLTEQCVASFRLCLSRFPQHYKSLYRLAFLYTYSKTHRVSELPAHGGAGEGFDLPRAHEHLLSVGGQTKHR